MFRNLCMVIPKNANTFIIIIYIAIKIAKLKDVKLRNKIKQILDRYFFKSKCIWLLTCGVQVGLIIIYSQSIVLNPFEFIMI